MFTIYKSKTKYFFCLLNKIFSLPSSSNSNPRYFSVFPGNVPIYLTVPFVTLPPGRENLIKSFNRTSLIVNGAYGRLALYQIKF